MFTPAKIAQMAAFFTEKQGGTIDMLKLVKLLYLADREAMDRFGEPISYDNFFSMDTGPVGTNTLNLLDGFVGGADGAKWGEWISDRENHKVSLNREFGRDDLDELSDADLEVLGVVWQQFGRMDKWTIRDWTHNNCGEWQDPEGSRLPITDAEILREVGLEPEEADELAADIQAERHLDSLLSTQ